MRTGVILFPSDEMYRQVAADIRADYLRAREEVEKTGRELNRLSLERAYEAIEQENSDRKTIESLKPSLLQWLLPRVR